jgi:L-amino acid N-acyltransferase YncA
VDLTRRKRLYTDTLERYQFRTATPEDVEGILDLWPEHWAEAHYRDRGIEPDEDRYREWLGKVLIYGLQTMLVCSYDGEIVGFFAFSLDHNFSKKPVAVMGTFFVRKAHRRTAVVPILFELGVAAAKDEGACAFHAPITSETQSSRALENMFKHQGFTVIGTMMGRAL